MLSKMIYASLFITSHGLTLVQLRNLRFIKYKYIAIQKEELSLSSHIYI